MILKNSIEKKKTFYFKGKKVTEKIYNMKMRMQEVGKNLRNPNIYCCRKTISNNLKKIDNINFVDIEGRRIIHVKTIAENLICKKCNAILSLLDTLEEERFGLASVYSIKCRGCDTIQQVCSDKKHTVKQTLKTDTRSRVKEHFNVNTKAPIGKIIYYLW